MTSEEEHTQVVRTCLLTHPFHSLEDIATRSLLIAEQLHLHISKGMTLLGTQHIGKVVGILDGHLQRQQFLVFIIPYSDNDGEETRQVNLCNVLTNQANGSRNTVTLLVLCKEHNGTVAVGYVNLNHISLLDGTRVGLTDTVNHHRNLGRALQSLCQQLVFHLNNISMEQRLVFRIENANHWGTIRHTHLLLYLFLGIAR